MNSQRSRPAAGDPVDRSVVINADDFGIHPNVNRAIVQGHREGVVTSASIMACGVAFDDAVSQSKTCPGLGVGVHLTLVEERPLTPPGQVSSLVGRAGTMPESYMDFSRRWMSRRIRPEDVKRELETQIERVLRAGITPSHLDSHQHVHCLPGVWKATIELAKKYSIPFVRLPYFDSIRINATPMQSAVRWGVNVMAAIRRRRADSAIRHADHVRGFAFSGRMSPERLLSILQTIRPGLTEIMVHPGIPSDDLTRKYAQWKGFSWKQDLDAVTDPRIATFCAGSGIALRNFSCARGRSI